MAGKTGFGLGGNTGVPSTAPTSPTPQAPPKKGGIDPNTGEWSENPEPLHVAGTPDGHGGFYGVGAPAETGQSYGFRNTPSLSSDSEGGYQPQFGGKGGGANYAANMYGQLATDARHRTGPQIDNAQATADYGLSMEGRNQQNIARGSQSDALGLQRAAAMGQVPSAAQIQMQSGIDAATRAQMAMANSAKGGGSAMAAAQRQALSSGADMQMQGVQQKAALRAQEMEAARNSYMQGATGIRGQDLNSRAQDLQQMGLSQDQAYRQAQLEAGQRALNDQTGLGYSGLANQVMLGQLSADTNVYDTKSGATASGDQLQFEKNKQANDNIMSGLRTMGGGLMSDIRAKTSIAPAGASQVAALSEGTKRPGASPAYAQSLAAAMRPAAAPSASASLPPVPPDSPTMNAVPSPIMSAPSQPMAQAPMRPMPMPGLMSDEDVKIGVRYTSGPDYYGKAKHNDDYRNAKVKAGSDTHSASPETAALRLERAGMTGSVFSDARVKADVHAAGYEAGLKAALAAAANSSEPRLSKGLASDPYPYAWRDGDSPLDLLRTGNGTAAQRNENIDAELARLEALRAEGPRGGTPAAPNGLARLATGTGSAAQRNSDIDAELARIAASDAQPRAGHGLNFKLADDGSAGLSRLASGNGTAVQRNADIDAELARLSAQLPAQKAAPQPSLEPIESLHQPPYSTYYEDADKNLPLSKPRNEDNRLADMVMSDANVKTVDARPVYKEQYADTRAKMKNENHSSRPEKDSAHFPMQPRRELASVMSDERAKDVRPGGETEADQTLDTFKPFSYRYKDESLEPTDSPHGGRYLGIMAQNAMKGPTGDTLVKETPRGLALEGGALMSALAAGAGRLHERVSALESQIAKSKKSK